MSITPKIVVGPTGYISVIVEGRAYIGIPLDHKLVEAVEEGEPYLIPIVMATKWGAFTGTPTDASNVIIGASTFMWLSYEYPICRFDADTLTARLAFGCKSIMEYLAKQ